MMSKNAVLMVGVVVLAVLAGVLYESPATESELVSPEESTVELARADEEDSEAEDVFSPRRDIVAPAISESTANFASVEIHVVHEDGAPAADFQVSLGLSEDGERLSTSLRTDVSGRAVFEVAVGVRIIHASLRAMATTTVDRKNLWRDVEGGELIQVELTVSGGWPLSGRVVDQDGRGVPNAEVLGWCRSRDTAEPDRVVRADSNGEFHLEHMGPEFVATARAEGLACSRGLRGKLSDGVIASGLTIELVPAKHMLGVVLDPNRIPVPGAEVWIQNGLNTSTDQDRTQVSGVTTFSAGSARTVSDEEGRFVIAVLPRDQHTVHAKKKPFLIYQESRSTGDERVEIVLDAGLSLSGQVFDAEGHPAAGARVRFWPYFGNVQTSRRVFECDEDGRFTLIGVRPKSEYGNTYYVLAVLHDGHSVHVVEQVRPSREGGEFVEVNLKPEHVLAGRVLDEAGQPVQGVTVWVEGDREMEIGIRFNRRSTWEFCNHIDELKTDGDGRFRFRNLYDGDFTVHAISPEDTNQTVDLETHAGHDRIELVLDSEVMRKVVFVGNVYDAVSKQPITSFTLIPTINGSGRYNSFDSAEGDFELSGLAPAKIQLTVKSDGYADRQIAYKYYDIGEHQVEFLLAPMRSLELLIVDEAGESYSNGHVEVFDLSGQRLMFGSGQTRYSSTNLRSGNAILHGLPAERLTLRVLVGVRDEGGAHEFPIDLTRSIEGPYELVVKRSTAMEPSVPLSLVVLVLGPDADESEVREGLSRSLREHDGGWVGKAVQDGTLSFPGSKVEILTECGGTELSQASLTPKEGGSFLASLSQTTRYWGGMGSSSSSKGNEVQFPLLPVGNMPARKVLVNVKSTGYYDVEEVVDCGGEKDLIPLHFILLRRE